MTIDQLAWQVAHLEGQVQLLMVLLLLLAIVVVAQGWLFWRYRSGQQAVESTHQTPQTYKLDPDQQALVRQAERALIEQQEPDAEVIEALQPLVLGGNRYLTTLCRFLAGEWRSDEPIRQRLNNDLKAWFAEFGPHPWINLMRADLALVADDLPQTDESLRLVLEQRPREPAIWQRQAELHLRRSEPDYALDCLQKAVEIDQKRAEVWLAMGWAELLTGRPDIVIQHLGRANEAATEANERLVRRTVYMVATLARTVGNEMADARVMVEILFDLYRDAGTAQEMLTRLEKIAPIYGESAISMLQLREILKNRLSELAASSH